jgi:hypothetical protein
MSRSASTPADAVPPPRPGSDSPEADPLDDIRLLLDGLAPSAAPASLASTTIEMAAVPAGEMMSRTGSGATTTRGGRPAETAAWPPVRQWLPGARLLVFDGATGAGAQLMADVL